MLMMCRQSGETILIGDDIEIVIAHIGRSRVRVGIRAPREMKVVAKEVKVVEDANVAAAQASGRALTNLGSFTLSGLRFRGRSPMSGGEGRTGGTP